MRARAFLFGLMLWFAQLSMAFAQCSGQAASGYVCGNGAAAQGFATFYPQSSLLDRAFGSAQGTLINRGASAWSATDAPSLGLNGSAGGSLTLQGATSGSAQISVADVAGTVLFQLPSTDGSSGNVLLTDGGGHTSWGAVVADSIKVGTTTVSGGPGLLYNTSSGGALTALAAVDGAVVSYSSSGTLQASRTPTIGVAGSALGTLSFANATSGTVTIEPATGALGTAIATLPAGTYNLVGDSLTQTLSNKTIDTAAPNTIKINGNTLSASAGTATVTVPAATDTLVARATTDTLTNKTLNCASNTCTVRIGSDVSGLGTGVAGALGVNIGSAGAPVLFNGAGGTPSSLALTNATGLPISTGVSGLGTGVATALGTNVGSSGSVVVNGGALGTPSSGSLANATGLPFAGLASAAVATSAQYVAGTASKLVPANIAYTSETTTTFGATTTFNFSTFINTAVTLTGNITTMTVSNIKAGQAGQIRFIQDATGARTTVWNSVFKFAGGTAPTLSTGANDVDALEYNCISTSYCVASLIQNVK